MITKKQPHRLVRLFSHFSGFPDKFLPALGTGNGDLALATGYPDPLAALGAVKVAVVTVLQRIEQLHEFPVFLIPAVGIAGEGAENGPEHQAIGHKGSQQIQHRKADECADQGDDHTGYQDGHIQAVRAVAARHKPAESLAQIRHKLFQHRNHLAHGSMNTL